MKQGRASVNASDPKREPISHPVSVAAVSELGAHVGRNPPGAIHSAPGVQAPVAACTVHRSGSQGKR